MITFYLTKLPNAIPLSIRLCFYAFIKFKKPHSFSGKFSLGSKMGYVGLLCFGETIKPLINFSTMSGQQKEIIFYFFRMTKLIKYAFDKEHLTLDGFREAISGNKKSDNSTIQKITTSIHRIKELAPNNPYHNEFLENLVKTEETRKVRDTEQRSSVNVSSDEALRAAEDRGNFYFLAFIYALNPTNLNVESEDIVRLSGPWFQIIDDYSDRKKDRGKKNTPFTISQEKSFRIFEQYMMKYQKQIQAFINSGHSLIKFMKGLSVLWPLFVFVSPSKDWHPD